MDLPVLLHDDRDYKDWLMELKERFFSHRLKASCATNGYLLDFYWKLGRDIEAKQYANTYGSGFYKNLSLDLKNEKPGVKGFSPINLRHMSKFFKLYAPLYGNIPQSAELFSDSLSNSISIPWDHHRRIIDICKDKDKVVAKYALESYKEPMGISEYQLSKLFPKDFKSSMPTIEELEKGLKENQK